LPTEGKVTLAGQDLFNLTEDGRAEFRAENVGFVFQTVHLLPALTALENVMVPLELLGQGGRGNGRPIRERSRGLLDRVGLANRTDHYPAQLSGGERQRVALARAFSNDRRWRYSGTLRADCRTDCRFYVNAQFELAAIARDGMGMPKTYRFGE
jgi:putative ABC transport system ATP-binding protein